jgi:hypothetical protein
MLLALDKPSLCEVSVLIALHIFSTITLEGETLYPPNADPVLTLTGSFSLLR